ncbi:MAG: cytochrome c3 family protein [Desulfobacterales bacterium]
MHIKSMRMKVLGVILVILYGSVVAADIEKKGPEKITLDGGQKGVINFPHRQHQRTLGDCKTCHDIFPQKLGVIKEFKVQGKLEKKQVMNHCRGCHRKLIKQGKKAGPTSCRGCHSI